MKEGIGVHPTWTWPLIGNVHADTVVTTWIVMLLVLVGFGFVGRSYRDARVGRTQTVFEGVVQYISDMVYGSLGPTGEAFVPFFMAIFVLIFFLDQFGFFPFKELGAGFGGSPTADLNTTVAYALIVFFTIQIVAIRKKGIGAYKHIVVPPGLPPGPMGVVFYPLLVVIGFLEEIVRPVTLAARLFFNIFVGELLFIIVASIIEAKVSVGAFNLSLAAGIVPVVIEFFNFFVGTVQAFVFTLLGIVYLSLATADDH